MPIIPDSRVYTIKRKKPKDVYKLYCSEINEMQIDDLSNDETWHYIESNTTNNKNLIKSLDNLNLLKSENHICDCGIGLGKILFDIYLSCKNVNKQFYFYGIEKETHYIDLFERSLRKYWGNNLKIFQGDIMDHDYSSYNIVYTYTPFKDLTKLVNFYKKVLNEIKEGSVLIEHIEEGKGMNKCLIDLVKDYDNIIELSVDDYTIYYKKEM